AYRIVRKRKRETATRPSSLLQLDVGNRRSPSPRSRRRSLAQRGERRGAEGVGAHPLGEPERAACLKLSPPIMRGSAKPVTPSFAGKRTLGYHAFTKQKTACTLEHSFTMRNRASASLRTCVHPVQTLSPSSLPPKDWGLFVREHVSASSRWRSKFTRMRHDTVMMSGSTFGNCDNLTY